MEKRVEMIEKNNEPPKGTEKYEKLERKIMSHRNAPKAPKER